MKRLWPLPFDVHNLDWIYGLLVITHLSEEALNAWLAEFHRILKPGSILTLTTNGTRCEELFSPEELQAYRKLGIAVRCGVAWRKAEKCISPSMNPALSANFWNRNGKFSILFRPACFSADRTCGPSGPG